MARSRRILVSLAAVSVALPAFAAPIFTASPEGDWFDGASWDGGTAPTAGDAPVIDNGGTADASSESPLYPGAGSAVQAASLAIGSRTDTTMPLDASGALAMTDVDLSLTGDLAVGAVALKDSAEVSTVSGSLSAVGGDSMPGNISAREVRVGAVVLVPDGGGGTEDTRATGTLAIDGDLQAMSRLGVGVTEVPGATAGNAVIGGDIRITDRTDLLPVSVEVGVATVHADIPVTLTTGLLTVAGDLEAIVSSTHDHYNYLRVGVVNGDAATDGRLDVVGDLLGFNHILVGSTTSNSPGASAVGELNVAGHLDSTDAQAFGFIKDLGVGVSSGGFFGGSATASGHAKIGEIDSRSVDVGISDAQSGSATGVLEIGSGFVVSARVGITGSDADANGTLVTGGDLQDAEVGVSGGAGSGQLFAVGDAVGSVAADGFIHSALVGSLSSDGSATGYLEVESVVRPPNPVGAAPSVHVGTSDRGAGTADGHMVVRSGGIDVIDVKVGWLNGRPFSRADGTVTGLLESTGDVKTTSFTGDAVGVANAYSTGAANGTWILHEATYASPKLSVGVSLGTATATGLVHLDRTHVDVDDLTLGDGATIELEIQGALRGAEYSAIDATVANLNGVLVVQLGDFAQVGVYDLIVSGALDGIAGAFDAVSVSGLAAGLQALWGVETVGDVSPVAAFRLHIVPEPASGSLLALGLLGIALGARRSS